ncbi:hypothetical protein AL057_05055 [Pseudomonas amygdali pv. myricae]|nr:hypothetical protein AL065_10025 [Pseudomonas amygdali pv. ulmi]KWS46981.1 hypothetical protein AL057_05055 [Pseudomonas amygdali pv. myricae]RMT53458.1 hypothetical protein ALP46_200107 [Pseudomonas amygdali pv. myricae]
MHTITMFFVMWVLAHYFTAATYGHKVFRQTQCHGVDIIDGEDNYFSTRDLHSTSDFSVFNSIVFWLYWMA